MFLGTPHRGSEKAAYGKVLANLATTVLHKPSPRLVNALRVNSEALMRLTTEFRFQLPKYQVYSFYETKPMKMFSTLVSNKIISLYIMVLAGLEASLTAPVAASGRSPHSAATGLEDLDVTYLLYFSRLFNLLGLCYI